MVRPEPLPLKWDGDLMPENNMPSFHSEMTSTDTFYLQGEKLMKRDYVLSIPVLLVFAFCHAGSAEAEQAMAPQATPVATAVSQTHVEVSSTLLRFHHAVRLGNSNKNVVSSPFGAARIGEMLYDGAAGETKEALRQAFLTRETRANVCDNPETITKETENWYRLPNDKDLPFVSVDGIWAQKGFPFLPTYSDGLQKKFAPQIAEADFRANAEAETATINAWVAQATDGKIEALFERLNLETKLVLVNAISFHGKWDTPFDPNDTKAESFYSTPGNPVEMPFMRKTMRVGYQESQWGQSIEIPYENGRYSMVVILPPENRMLQELESQIHLDGTMEYSIELVDIRLPKFEMESEIDLRVVLTQMGAGVVFDSNAADFSAMSDSGGLYVGQAKQKVFIRVDEAGTEAVAATGAAVVLKSLPAPELTPKVFQADKPFLFVIWENTTHTPLFIGRFVGVP